MLHCELVNDMNVFPVPDGDTGTNMVYTLQNGFSAVAGRSGELPELCSKFANAVVFGARGSSGVIISQFFKGVSERLAEKAEASCADVIAALIYGVELAYQAVSDPKEGTILTVLREATDSLHEVDTINDLISEFLRKAREALQNTPNLLPILKAAGVVDSGGAGIVYFFEGVEKYLNNEEIRVLKDPAVSVEEIDYSIFNAETRFEYGYCTELLIQLTGDNFDLPLFKKELEQLGQEAMAILMGDKVKLHVHTHMPENVMAYCHRFGEFLTLKIENMSVQNANLQQTKIICNHEPGENFAIVAVAFDETMKERFLQMGVDVVLQVRPDAQPSTQDFLQAFQGAKAPQLIIFPNSANAYPAAAQACKLSGLEGPLLLDTKSVAECYAALSMIDFDAETAVQAARDSKQIIENMKVIGISRAIKDTVFEGNVICTGDFLAFEGKQLYAVSGDLTTLVQQVCEIVLAEKERDTITVFGGKAVSEQMLREIQGILEVRFMYTELDMIPTQCDTFELLLSFE